MKALALLAAALLAAPSAPVETGPGTRYYAGLPPVRYVKGGFVAVLFVHPAQLYEACGTKPIPGMVLHGCSRVMKTGQKAIIVSHPCLALDGPYSAILCHESAHALGGWPGTHPL